MNSTFKTAVFWIVMLCTAVLLWKAVNAKSGEKIETISFSQFMDEVEEGNIEEITATGQQIEGQASSGKFQTTIPQDYPKVFDLLTAQGVTVNVKDQASLGFWSMFWRIAPLVLIVFFWIFMMRQLQAGGNRALSFGKSRARLLTSQQKKVTFKDVAGVDEAKEELQEIIEFLREPQKFQKLGGRIPKGVLLIGPPGTGKTLLARAVAGEANVCRYFSISTARSSWRCSSASAPRRVRDLFEQGKKSAPCIVFIDEIDAVGRRRGAGLGGGHDEREQTLNADPGRDGRLRDGRPASSSSPRPIAPMSSIPALLRPGRFDREIAVDRVAARREAVVRPFCRVHARQGEDAPDDVDLIEHRAGHSGLLRCRARGNLVNESAILATMQNRKDYVFDGRPRGGASDKVIRWGRAKTAAR